MPIALIYLVILVVMWGYITGDLSWPNLTVGVIVSTALLLVLRVRSTRVDISSLPMRMLYMIIYILLVTYNVVSSSLDVARRVLHPRMPIKPGIFAVPGHGQSDLRTALTAHAITMAPGEVVVDIDPDGTLYVHALDATDPYAMRRDISALRAFCLERIFP